MYKEIKTKTIQEPIGTRHIYWFMNFRFFKRKKDWEYRWYWEYQKEIGYPIYGFQFGPILFSCGEYDTFDWSPELDTLEVRMRAIHSWTGQQERKRNE